MTTNATSAAQFEAILSVDPSFSDALKTKALETVRAKIAELQGLEAVLAPPAEALNETEEDAPVPAVPVKRGPGRPKGSTNKGPKAPKAPKAPKTPKESKPAKPAKKAADKPAKAPKAPKAVKEGAKHVGRPAGSHAGHTEALRTALKGAKKPLQPSEIMSRCVKNGHDKMTGAIMHSTLASMVKRGEVKKDGAERQHTYVLVS